MSFIVLFGGNSYEHEISIVSAITIKKELDNISHFIFVDSSGELYDISNMTSKHFSTLNYKKDSRLTFCDGGFSKASLFGAKKIEGIVINLIHGKSGEDGQIASILDYYHIPFIGPRCEGSVLSFNKELTKLYATSRNVSVLPYTILKKGDELKADLPCIIKPSRLGSSIGISVIKDESEIEYALDNAFEYDEVAIVESFIPNIKEYNLAGCKVNDKFIFSIIEEVRKDEYLNFDNKYLDFQGEHKKQEADIDEALKEKLKDSFRRIYEDYFLGALIRCDFFVIDDRVYLNEINPVPGSMACYLFSDFKNVINSLSQSLPKSKKININYKYISKIQQFKGK